MKYRFSLQQSKRSKFGRTSGQNYQVVYVEAPDTKTAHDSVTADYPEWDVAMFWPIYVLVAQPDRARVF